MFLPDVNIWIALAMSGHTHHIASMNWFDSIHEPASMHFCRTTQQGFLRLSTNRAVQAQYGNEPLGNSGAWDAYSQLAGDDRVGRLLVEPESLEPIWRRFSSRATPSPKMWTDTYLAAFAIAAGATFVTIDKAFTQFDGLDLHLIE